jgi:hypothetical protein
VGPGQPGRAGHRGHQGGGDADPPALGARHHPGGALRLRAILRCAGRRGQGLHLWRRWPPRRWAASAGPPGSWACRPADMAVLLLAWAAACSAAGAGAAGNSSCLRAPAAGKAGQGGHGDTRKQTVGAQCRRRLPAPAACVVRPVGRAPPARGAGCTACRGKPAWPGRFGMLPPPACLYRSAGWSRGCATGARWRWPAARSTCWPSAAGSQRAVAGPSSAAPAAPAASAAPAAGRCWPRSMAPSPLQLARPAARPRAARRPREVRTAASGTLMWSPAALAAAAVAATPAAAGIAGSSSRPCPAPTTAGRPGRVLELCSCCTAAACLASALEPWLRCRL